MAAAQERLRREEDAAQLDAGSAFDQLSAAPALTPLTAYAAEIAAGAEAGESEEDLEQRARIALECPCVASLREGPCGAAFSDAFGSDCMGPFLAMQACMAANAEHFANYERDEGEEREEEGDGSNGQQRPH
eukprot:SM002063S06360  [mRNA]  locus=s2063:312:1679:+ [translate_table: standard]